MASEIRICWGHTASQLLHPRQAVGRFSYPEDLLLVPGIGEKRLEAIRGLICFE